RGYREPRRVRSPSRRASGPRAGRARGLLRRRPGLSLLLEGVRKSLGGATGAVHDVRDRGLRFLHVVIARGVDVLLHRALVGVGAATGVLAAEDPVVMAGFDPALQLGSPQ